MKNHRLIYLKMAAVFAMFAIYPLWGMEDAHLQVGERALPQEERVAEQRRCLELEKAHYNEVNLPKPQATILEKTIYKTTHAGVFHSPYKCGYVLFYIDGCVNWVENPDYTEREIRNYYPDAILVSWAVQLEDGSIWITPSEDRYLTGAWLTSDSIIIEPNGAWFSSYEYALININTGATIVSNLALGPLVNGYHTHWIVAISYDTDELFLEDGSVWQMCEFYADILRGWQIGDAVIMGINSSFFTAASHPNILINVMKKNYINCHCTW